MEDIQSSVDSRGIAIQHVGVRDIHLPFQIRTKEGDFQQVLARICFTVSLPQEYKERRSALDPVEVHVRPVYTVA